MEGLRLCPKGMMEGYAKIMGIMQGYNLMVVCKAMQKFVLGVVCKD